MKAQVDSVFGFLDKHLKEVALGVAALVIYKTIKGSVPTDDEKKTQAEEHAKQDVNTRLSSPPAPKLNKEGKLDPKEEKDYWVKQKAHRSALFATKLLDAMRTSGGIKRLADFGGSGHDTIMGVSWDAPLARVSLSMLQKDYLALQSSGLTGKAELLADLKSTLSTADYLLFMKRVGYTAEQASAALKSSKKSTAKK